MSNWFQNRRAKIKTKAFREKRCCSSLSRQRTTFQPAQIAVLERSFQQNPYPSQITKTNLAIQLDVAERVVFSWFQNRRAKENKQLIEEQQLYEAFLQQCYPSLPPR